MTKEEKKNVPIFSSNDILHQISIMQMEAKKTNNLNLSFLNMVKRLADSANKKMQKL